MGFFTWKFANRKFERLSSGEIAARCKLPYGGRGYVLCPDGSVIREDNYDGYGRFGGFDVYELVVDWNRGDLFYTLIMNMNTNPVLHGVAGYLDENRDDECQAYVDKMVDERGAPAHYKTDWKRSLGIEISFGRTAIDKPIKIVDNPKPRRGYARLPRSINCQ